MNDQTGASAQRRRTRGEIEQVVAEFAGSGLNRAAFCRGHGMSLGTLNRYLQRQREAGEAMAGGLVAVELTGPRLASDRDPGWGLTVVLSRGRRIEVGASFDAPTLQRLINLLETI